jgi:hypothetical protein
MGLASHRPKGSSTGFGNGTALALGAFESGRTASAATAKRQSPSEPEALATMEEKRR